MSLSSVADTAVDAHVDDEKDKEKEEEMSECTHLSKRKKLSGYGLYRDVLGSPKFVVAPMVDQSELPWRILSRRYGAPLIYTPMINAKMFAEGKSKKYREESFDIATGEEGSPERDRPLIVQFAGNDPEWLLRAAKLVECHCDAVDINFGCPQDIARRGRYGSFLQDDWELVHRLINTLHENLSVPVTAKFRVFPSLEKTVAYAKMMERAGAQILTCHGRTREQRGHNTGFADWEKIRAVKEAVSVPVFANGNILFHADMQRCLDATGADAVMTAEGNLYNPTILTSIASLASRSPDHDADISSSLDPLSPRLMRSPSEFFTLPDDPGAYLPHTTLAAEYLAIVRALRTHVASGAIKGHLFKLMCPALPHHPDLRERLGRVRQSPAPGAESAKAYVNECEEIVKELESRLAPEIEAAQRGEAKLEELVKVDAHSGLPILPRWLAQPYFRPQKEQAQQDGRRESHCE